MKYSTKIKTKLPLWTRKYNLPELQLSHSPNDFLESVAVKTLREKVNKNNFRERKRVRSEKWNQVSGCENIW